MRYVPGFLEKVFRDLEIEPQNRVVSIDRSSQCSIFFLFLNSVINRFPKMNILFVRIEVIQNLIFHTSIYLTFQYLLENVLLPIKHFCYIIEKERNITMYFICTHKTKNVML